MSAVLTVQDLLTEHGRRRCGETADVKPDHFVPGADTNHFMGLCLECDARYLATATWDEAHRWYREGRISQDEWEAFAHVWATSAHRHGPLGDGYRQEPESLLVRRLAVMIRGGQP